jgi:hypothetical protein
MTLPHSLVLGRTLVVVTTLGILAAGCNAPPEPPETVVTGSVTYKGQPVTGGTLIFQMKNAGTKRPYAGQIYEDGTYELTYVVPGEALIAVETATKQGLSTYVELPRKYSSPTKSGLKYQVVEGPQAFDIKLD